MADRRQELYTLTLEFLDAFNRNDLDAVMAFFTEDAVYDELNGRPNEGKAAVRAAFEPQFEGRFGSMEFVEDDTFVDAETGKVMSSWDLRTTKDGVTTVLRGLDLLHFDGALIRLKQTYVKAKQPRYETQD
ncbi:MAG: nuclear transport factor 2 family protein [Gammaproteobacteria bacterium]